MSTTVRQVTITAPDISCGHCVATVQEAVGGLSGVSEVVADAATKQVAVTFDPTQISFTQIESAMDEAGYPIQK